MALRSSGKKVRAAGRQVAAGGPGTTPGIPIKRTDEPFDHAAGRAPDVACIAHCRTVHRAPPVSSYCSGATTTYCTDVPTYWGWYQVPPQLL